MLSKLDDIWYTDGSKPGFKQNILFIAKLSAQCGRKTQVKPRATTSK